MVDKLEVRLPRSAPFTKEFGAMYADISSDPRSPFRSSLHYTATLDARPYGHSAILHLGCKRNREGNHKLELIETGGMSYAGMVHEVERIFDVDPRKLEVMRVDLCADVPDVPVAWFHDRVRVEYKRWVAKVGKLTPEVEFSAMGKGKMQTQYFGKRPNCYRFYDKTEERLFRYQQLCSEVMRDARRAVLQGMYLETNPRYVPYDVLPDPRKLSPDAELPTFEDIYGQSPRDVLTRVERVCAGDQVPLRLGSVRRIQQNARDFDPFERLHIVTGGKREPDPNDYDPLTYLAGMYIREVLVPRDGMHWLRAYLNRNRNGARYLKKFRDFLPEAEGGITSARLFEIYRDSVSRQLAA